MGAVLFGLVATYLPGSTAVCQTTNTSCAHASQYTGSWAWHQLDVNCYCASSASGTASKNAWTAYNLCKITQPHLFLSFYTELELLHDSNIQREECANINMSTDYAAQAAMTSHNPPVVPSLSLTCRLPCIHFPRCCCIAVVLVFLPNGLGLALS